MDFKEMWADLKAAFTPSTPFNSMSAYKVAAIRDKVKALAPDFDVACMDTHFVNVRKNVGLVIPPYRPEEEILAAARAFAEAAKDVGTEVAKDGQVMLYQKDKAPTPSRFVQPSRPVTYLTL